MQKKDKNVPKKPNSFMHPYRNKIFKTLRETIGTLLVLLIIFFLLSGAINQVKTGETFVNYSLRTGKKISVFFKNLVSKEGPLKITKDGVYFKDAEIPQDSALPNK